MNLDSAAFYAQCCGNFSSTHTLHTPTDVEQDYFLYYVLAVSPLIVASLLLNAAVIVATVRLHNRALRHSVLLSLCSSDPMLSILTLLKRCHDHLPADFTALRDFFRWELNCIWQLCFLMTAVGLLAFSVDGILAIRFPFAYNHLTDRWAVPIGVILVWLMNFIFVAGLRISERSYDDIIQIIICIFMVLLLLFVAFSYVAICIQAEQYRRRCAEKTSRKDVLQRGKLKSCVTTALLVGTCYVCWSPLIIYLFLTRHQITGIEQTEINCEELACEDAVVRATNQVLSAERAILVALFFLHLGPVLDPLIFCLRMRDVRHSATHICCPKLWRRRRQSETDSDIFGTNHQVQRPSAANIVTASTFRGNSRRSTAFTTSEEEPPAASRFQIPHSITASSIAFMDADTAEHL